MRGRNSFASLRGSSPKFEMVLSRVGFRRYCPHAAIVRRREHLYRRGVGGLPWPERQARPVRISRGREGAPVPPENAGQGQLLFAERRNLAREVVPLEQQCKVGVVRAAQLRPQGLDMAWWSVGVTGLVAADRGLRRKRG